MTTQTEAMKLALEALKQIDEAMPFPVAKLAQKVLREALAEQPAQPMTDEQIDALPLPPSGTATVRDLVRIIEAAHGITKGNT